MTHSFVALPLLFALISAIVVYGVCLPIVQVHPTSTAAHVVATVLWLLYFWCLCPVLIVGFLREYFEERLSIRESLWGFLNIVFTALHGVAVVGMSLWLFGGDTIFSGPFPPVPAPGISMYRVFFAAFMSNAGNYVVGAGTIVVRTAQPEASAWATAWSLLGGMTGVIVVVIVFSIITTPLRRATRQKRPNTTKPNHRYLFVCLFIPLWDCVSPLVWPAKCSWCPLRGRKRQRRPSGSGCENWSR